jgi:glutathione S-transferase
MITLWQTEWCPASRRVRQRLTELDVAYIVRQVPVEKTDRDAFVAATGPDSIPALVLENDTTIADEVEIRRWLDANVAEPAGAEAHRAKAAKARKREVERAAEELLAAQGSRPVIAMPPETPRGP